jgi:hypothetical protein
MKTINNVVFWHVTLCGRCENGRFRGKHRPIIRTKTLLVIAKIVSSSLIPLTLIMGGIISSETLVHTTATQHHIPQDGILHGSPSETNV